ARPPPAGALHAPLAAAALFQALLEGAKLLPQGCHLAAERVRLAGGLGLALGRGRRHRLGAGPRPARARRPLAEHAVGFPLARHDRVEARLHRGLEELLPGLPVLDELVEEGGGQRGAVVALVLEDDLGERHRGQILAGGDVHHRDLLARANELLELFQRDVAALLRIVELAIGVSLDHVRHGASLTPRVRAHKPTRPALLYWHTRPRFIPST